MSNFIVEFKLNTEIYPEHILEKRFEIARKIYNSLVTKTQKRYHELVKTKEYRKIQELLLECRTDKNDKLRKECLKELNLLYKKYSIGEYFFHSDVKEFQHYFKKNIDSFTAQKIATTLWKSYEKLLFGKGEKVHYKKYDSLHSLEGKSNNTGIRFIGENLTWLGLKIPVVINKNNQYEQEALRNHISYCRIIKKFVRTKNKYYLQIVFEGTPPTKVNSSSGLARHEVGIGRVGLDIGTQTLAVSSDKEVKILELADKVKDIEKVKRIIGRKMDRSKRTSNKDNFNIDGTIKKQGNKKVIWLKSKRYIKLQQNLKELFRKQADVRKYQHEKLANEIIAQGDEVYVETMSFSGLQRRAKNTEQDENGKFKRKKRFGKSLGMRAPSMFLSILDRKLKKVGKTLIKIDTWSVKASQYNHVEDNYKKKKLSNRWNEIEGKKVQRDMYSAFLIMNIDSTLKSVDKIRCEETYEKFLKLHDSEVQRLTGNKNLSSIAI